MKNYLEYKKSRANFSIYYHLHIIFKRIETGLFVFLCVALLITSKVSKEVNKDISMFFVDLSIPITKFVSTPFTSIGYLLTNTTELLEARSENRALKIENEKLKSLYIKALNINQENKELRSVVRFVGTRNSKYLVANLISKSNEIYGKNIYINAGLNQGVKEDSIVTGRSAVIGRVFGVSEDKSKVLLITDINSRIPIITSRSRTRGILAGNNSNSMEILYLEKNHRIAVGDMVFTSGDGDSIPPGLLVGVVDKIDHGFASVRMVEDLSNTDMVTVIEY